MICTTLVDYVSSYVVFNNHSKLGIGANGVSEDLEISHKFLKISLRYHFFSNFHNTFVSIGSVSFF